MAQVTKSRWRLRSLGTWLHDVPHLAPFVERRKIRLLAVVQLCLIAATLFRAVFPAPPIATAPQAIYWNHSLAVNLSVIVVLVLLYFLSGNGRRYKLSATLTIELIAVTIFIDVITNPRPEAAFNLAYLIIPVLLSGLLLTADLTILVAMMNFTGILLLPLVTTALSFSTLISPLLFDAVASATIIVIMLAERQNIEQTQQFLSESSKVLASSLDVEMTLDNLAHLLVPRLADWCAIDILEADGNFHRAATLHCDPSKIDLMRELQNRYRIISPESRHTVLKVFRANQSWLDPEVSLDRFEREARDPEHLRILRGLGFKSEIVVALASRDQLLGTLTLVSAHRNLTRSDLAVAEELARRAALSLENARLYAAEQRAREEAENAQQRFTFLAEASNVLNASLKIEEVLDSVVKFTVPRLADGCSLDIFDETDILHRVAVSHVIPAKAEIVKEIFRRYPPDLDASYGLGKALKTAQPQYIAQADESDWVSMARDEHHLRMLRELKISFFAVIPFTVNGHVLGAMSLFNTERTEKSQKVDVDLAVDLASRVAIALDNSRLYREAQNALFIRDQFLSIAAHELKTPLTSLRGNSQILQRRAERDNILAERDKRSIDVIQTQTLRLTKLIDTLLDTARLQLGSFTIDLNPFDITTLIQRLVSELQLTMERHTITLHSVEEALMLNGDELRIEQVFQNLLQNAIKYSPDGGPITVRVDHQGNQVCISVIDQGIGIPESAQINLFQRFYRASNFNPNHISGMGIGLFVVKEIVTLHNGTITVNSREGEGSTFTVMLPLMESAG